MKLAVVQNKPRKGDVAANVAALATIFVQLAAEPEPYDLIVFPEAALTGYFLEGAVYELAFDAEALATRVADLWRVAPGSGRKSVDIVLGFYENAGGTYYNSALYVTVGGGTHALVHVHRKMFLPTYGVFDEERFLSRGRRLQAFDTRMGRMAMLICEDAWHAIMPTIAAIKGARVLVIPSASPGRGLTPEAPGRGVDRGGELESTRHWKSVLADYAVEHGVFVIYAGLAGFEGGKGMAGSSAVIDPFGETIASLPALGAHVLRATLDFGEIDVARARLPLLGDLGAVLPDLIYDDELQPSHARRYVPSDDPGAPVVLSRAESR
ncbi:MAG: carbon-nitrogen hydrolase [Vulcanimicrobiaceae bacterium]